MEKQAYDDLSLSAQKNLYSFEDARLSSKLSKELLIFSELYKDSLKEIFKILKNKNYTKKKIRVDILRERINYLTTSLRETSEELDFIAIRLKNLK
ncbi:hypothetical protein COMNV_00483 [Commensalibacter sp. Nvir]|uniref:hypothetical protein n=1 Tax=Commensalibacter sp. Nvir TaxID=3069817 RepID=UPI002D2C3A50|nr:hypothetical protein COMNV_00483 [Commensalibacter sp. Nvir]